MLLNPCTISSFSSFPLPADKLPNDLCIYDSLPVLVVCLVCSCFCFLDLVVDGCEFVAFNVHGFDLLFLK